MAAVRVGGAVVGAAGDQCAEALADAFQLISEMEEALRQQEKKVEEALRLQEQNAAWRHQETLKEMEVKLQEKDEAIRALEQRLEEKVRRIEGRMAAVEGRLSASEERGSAANGEGMGDLELLESRMKNLESSVERALGIIHVDAQLDAKAAPPTPSPTSTSAAPTSSGGPISSSPHVPRRRRRVASSSGPSTSSAPSQQPAAPERGTTALEEGLLKAITAGGDVRAFLDAGADVNVSDEHRRTPLMLASVCREDAVALLLERGADYMIHAKNEDGWTALHYAASHNRSGHSVSLLVAAGAPLESHNHLGRTPLHNAAVCNNDMAARVLLAAGADTSAVDRSGRTPFYLARPRVRELLHP